MATVALRCTGRMGSMNGLRLALQRAAARAEARAIAVRAFSVSAATPGAPSTQGLPELNAAHTELKDLGYTRVQVGASASLNQLENVCRKLMGLDEVGGGQYNGGGGVTRNTIGDSGFLNGSAGAPSELPVQFHNEMAYSADVPKHLAFAMLTQAGEGGTTTLADNLEVTAQLSDNLKKRLQETGVCYVRNLSDESERGNEDFFMSWQGAFQTNDIAEAVRKATREDSSAWVRDADRQRLRHICWCPVFAEHPEHGVLYFSSILNRHGSWLDGHKVFGQLPHMERPYHCLWGDGAEFSEEDMAEIRDVHERCTIKVRLDQGDVLVMDNLRVAHGRTSFVGDRLIGLLLSDTVRRVYTPPAMFHSFVKAAPIE